MSEVLYEAYLDYLEPQMGAGRNSKTYRDLLTLLSQKEFVWFVPNDDNRIMDGLEIRNEWLRRFNIGTDFGPCSFLEMMIGMTRRMEFLTSEHAEGWSWQLLINLELHKMKDPLSRYKVAKVDGILDTVIWRTYRSDGVGGLFPLTHPREDQRKMELWYQMNAYINEIHPEF